MFELHVQGADGYWSLVGLFSFGSKSSWLYNILDTLAINMAMPRKFSWSHLFQLLPTQCTWTRLLLACHPHKLHSVSAENTSVLFNIGTRCTSCYFFNQGLSSATALTDVKGIFKMSKGSNTRQVSLNSSQALTFTFELIPLGKLWTPLSPQLWVK